MSPEVVKDESQPVGGDILTDESITRFDKQNNKSNNRKKSRNRKKPPLQAEGNNKPEKAELKPTPSPKTNIAESEVKKNKNRRNNQQRRRKRPSNKNNDANPKDSKD